MNRMQHQQREFPDKNEKGKLLGDLQLAIFGRLLQIFFKDHTLSCSSSASGTHKTRLQRTALARLEFCADYRFNPGIFVPRPLFSNGEDF